MLKARYISVFCLSNAELDGSVTTELMLDSGSTDYSKSEISIEVMVLMVESGWSRLVSRSRGVLGGVDGLSCTDSTVASGSSISTSLVS